MASIRNREASSFLSGLGSNLIVLLIFLLIVSAFLEIAIRILRPQMTYSRLLLLTGEQYVKGGSIPFTLKPNYRALQPSQEYPEKMVKITTNSLGLRGKELRIGKAGGVKRILTLGDSYTFGVCVEDWETYPAVLERILNERGQKVEVVNAGYADGWSPDEHYVWLTKEGLKFKPDLILYGFFIGNDITDINLKNWVALDKKGLPTKIVNPNIYIDKLGRIRSRINDLKTVGGRIDLSCSVA